ncbi:unnamed protein product [Amoebophrya sp. A120]|nr:unnamed protein product [Amoebophrya sp. A120]|eukprot:GSA120T00011476001.1
MQRAPAPVRSPRPAAPSRAPSRGGPRSTATRRAESAGPGEAREGDANKHGYVSQMSVDQTLRKLHVHTACITFLEHQFDCHFVRAKQQIREDALNVRRRMDQALLNKTRPVPELVPQVSRTTSMPSFVQPKAKRLF